MKIAKILARQILDSRGNPTVEADVYEIDKKGKIKSKQIRAQNEKSV